MGKIKKSGLSFTEKLLDVKENYQFKSSYQGITLDAIEQTLKCIDLYSEDIRDAVWCLLNDEIPSFFSKAREAYKINSGATTAHVGGIIGKVLRDGEKLDREGRDYWIKPLRQIGAIEACTYDSKLGFIAGHPKAKSPNSCYRLNSSFIALLKEFGKETFDQALAEWISEDSIRDRFTIQTATEKASKASIEGDSHQSLIQQSIALYAAHFLPGYILIYKDDSDGDRITDEERALMQKYGIRIELEDSFPDAMFYNPETSSLWFIEAVTSDGEVDEHKLEGLKKICKKCGKNFGGATTTYLTWKAFAARQKTYKNLGDSSKVWLLEDPQKEFDVQYYKKSSKMETESIGI